MKSATASMIGCSKIYPESALQVVVVARIRPVVLDIYQSAKIAPAITLDRVETQFEEHPCPTAALEIPIRQAMRATLRLMTVGPIRERTSQAATIAIADAVRSNPL
jgi:hypothetical protein